VVERGARPLLILLLPLFCATSAQAAEIPVLQRDGTVEPRFDPGVAARDITATPHRLVRPRAAPAGGRATMRELRRIRNAGRITPAEYREYRYEYKRCRAFARNLSGARELDMKGVLASVDRMAARGVLKASRLAPLWLQLRRNREWWSSGSLLYSGQRVSFEGTELIFQYFPGEGLQIHPLANFGKLNWLWRDKRDERMKQLLGELLPLAAERAGGVAWEYYMHFGGGSPPWVSSLAQGTGLGAMARAANRAGGPVFAFPLLRRGLEVFERRTPAGVRVPVPGPGVHYAQYSFAPGLRIINGFVQSLNGLSDYARISGEPAGERLYRHGELRARREVPTYDTGAWSLYDRGTDSHESDLNYHNVLIDFLQGLCRRTGTAVYCEARDNFQRYLREDPAVRVLTRRLRAGRPSRLRFRLSKISVVTLQLRRRGKVVYSYSGTLPYGTRTVSVTPPRRARRYEVRIVATDLAGNTGVETDTVAITRA
jgi:hypothetical protein